MAQGSFEVAAFLRARQEATRPDAMLLFAPYAFDVTKMPLGMQDEPSISIFGTVLRPDSRGSITLRSADPADKPVIRSNYLATPHDRAGFGGHAAVHPPARRGLAAARHRDGGKAAGRVIRLDDELVEAFRQFGSTGYHTIGTCGMGSHPTSVLDPDLRVRGVDGVRVMDASVLPYMVSGNTNAPVLAMADRAADLILAERQAEPPGRLISRPRRPPPGHCRADCWSPLAIRSAPRALSLGMTSVPSSSIERINRPHAADSRS